VDECEKKLEEECRIIGAKNTKVLNPTRTVKRHAGGGTLHQLVDAASQS
jgi:hypothetical protein